MARMATKAAPNTLIFSMANAPSEVGSYIRPYSATSTGTLLMPAAACMRDSTVG